MEGGLCHAAARVDTRSSIIWNRGNAFVEPTARDRPYRQYEFIFMFSKSRFIASTALCLSRKMSGTSH